LSSIDRARTRDLLWHAGATARLISTATRGKGERRRLALNRLAALADQRTLAPLLSAWPRLDQVEQEKVLVLAGKVDHPGLASLLWRAVASRADNPPVAMARMAKIVGPALGKSLGKALSNQNAPLWVWESLVCVGGSEAEQHLLDCLGRNDALHERAKHYFATAPSQILPMLMETARFHRSWEVRIGAVTALLGRKEPQALRFLTELLRDQAWLADRPGEGRTAPCLAWPALLGLRGSGRA